MSIRNAGWGAWRAANLEGRQKLDKAVRLAYDALVSPRVGLLSHLQETRAEIGSLSLWVYSALAADFSRYGCRSLMHKELSGGSGIGLSRHEAIIAALGEAVERYAACIYDAERDIVWAPYEDLADVALCPTRFTLPSEAERARSSKLAEFDPAEPIGWARGRTLPDQQPVLAPASFVYANYQFRSHKEQFGPGISTGLAAGPNWNWALMKGLCECVERDAVMITYLNRLPAPEIDLDAVDHPQIRDLLDRTPPWSQYRIRAWNVTLDIGIATVFAAVIGQNDEAPAFVCGAATHVDPPQALLKALLEACHSWHWIVSDIFPEYRDRVFSPSFGDVLSRRDHLGLASQRQYLEHCDWLLCDREMVGLESLPDLGGGTLEEELARAIEAVHQSGLQAAAFDLTTPDVEQAGFRVCRVLAPGVQQLMFGPTRMLGGERLYEAPRQLGYTEERPTEASLNPVPHPFP